MRAPRGVTWSLAAFVRRGGLLVVAGLLVGVLVASAQAATSTKFYFVTVTPSTVEASPNAAVPFVVTVTNSNTSPNVSTQTLGSANVTVPAGFTVTTPCCTASADGNKSWTAAYNAATRTIEFRAATSANALAPGEKVQTTIQAKTPSASAASADANKYTWVTRAKQSNSFSGSPGNDFIRVGSDPVVTVVGRLCKQGDATCQVSNGGTSATTAPPTSGTIEMTLLGDSDFSCNGVAVPVGLILLINAPSATANYTVTLNYAGVTGPVDVCKSTNGVDYTLLPDCNNTNPKNDPACVLSDTGTPGGREVVILLGPGDPYVGGS